MNKLWGLRVSACVLRADGVGDAGQERATVASAGIKQQAVQTVGTHSEEQHSAELPITARNLGESSARRVTTYRVLPRTPRNDGERLLLCHLAYPVTGAKPLNHRRRWGFETLEVRAATDTKR